MKNSSLKSFVKQFLAAISGMDKTTELIDRYVADPELREHLLMYEIGFPRYEMIPEEMVEEGNKVAVRLVVRAKHNNTFMEIPPTGRRLELPMMVIYEIENEKIVGHWMSYDRMLFMEQIGVMQPV
ncbi:MAG: ester cyclase [Bacteroidota bacterium]